MPFRQTDGEDETKQPDRDIDVVSDGIGARLRSLRRTRTMTLADLAQATGTSQATLSRSESGAWPAPTG